MGKTIVCHCEDITLAELYSALSQGYAEIESLKRYTGIATGKCQGKCCIVQTLRVLASTQGRAAVEDGLAAGPGEPLAPPTREGLDALVRIPTIRQPVVPIKINDIVEAGDTADASTASEDGNHE
jgi:bacterioferritin-associated ferredoxin